MSTTLPPGHPDQPEEQLEPLPSSIPDGDEDKPPRELVIQSRPANGSELVLPPVILGCATFGYGIYQDKSACVSDAPVRTVRLALRAGITAFDTAPFYHPSEVVLGRALEAVKDEFPRESYTLITKTGKYGGKVKDHIYDPELTKKGVERSLKRLHTDYLDVVYMHDVEYLADDHRPYPSGFPLDALTDPAKRRELNLEPPYAPIGPGEQALLATFGALRELQAEGKIRKVGIAGFPLPYLLRLALLIREQTGKPVDILQSFAHQTLLNSTLSNGYLEAFEKAGVKQVVNAAPLAMGILTTQGGPSWHPIRDVEGGRYYQATREAAKLCQERETSLEAVSSDFGYRPVHQSDGKLVPVVIGCKNLSEVHRALESYARVAYDRTDSRDLQEEVRNIFEKVGAADWSWANPSADCYED